VADKGYSYDVFFRVGENGLGEHIQITVDKPEDIIPERDKVMVGLTALGAIPLTRDTDYARSRPSAAPSPDNGNVVDVSKNPNRLPNATPVCPVDGAPMRLVTPRQGQTWPAFWSCVNYKTTGCSGKRSA
jgi:hypothetical protein